MSYRHGGNSASLTSTVTWTLTGIAISAYCAALVSSHCNEKPAGRKAVRSLARPRKFAADRDDSSLTSGLIRRLRFHLFRIGSC